MNKEYLRRLVGKDLRLLPVPIYAGSASPPRADEWTFVSYTDSLLTLRQVHTHVNAVLFDDSIRNVQSGTPLDFLLLNAQLTVVDTVVQSEPLLHPLERKTPKTLLAEAYLDAQIDCNEWGLAFLDVYAQGAADLVAGPTNDVWDLIEQLVPSYSAERFERYKHLFLQEAVRLHTRFDRLVSLFGRILPDDFQVSLVRAARRITADRTIYLRLPQVIQQAPQVDAEELFRGRFLSMTLTLKNLTRDAASRRNALGAEPVK